MTLNPAIRSGIATEIKTNRLIEIDYIKAISIIGVLFVHMSFESRFSPSALNFISAMQSCLGWCVLSFFFCSGLLADKSLKLSYADIQKFLGKKLRRLVVPFLAFNLLYKSLLGIIALSGIVDWVAPFPNSLRDMLTFVFAPVGPQLYFLLYLFIISCSYYILLFLFRKKYLVYTFICSLASLYYIFSQPLLKAHGPALELTLLYFISYALGVEIGAVLREGNQKVKYLLGVTFLLAVSLSYWKASFIYAFILIPPLLLLIFRKIRSLDSVKSREFPLGRLLGFVGNQSGAIYVWHAPILMPFLSIALIKLLGSSSLLLAALFFFSIAIPCLLDSLIRRFYFLKPFRL